MVERVACIGASDADNGAIPVDGGYCPKREDARIVHSGPEISTRSGQLSTKAIRFGAWAHHRSFDRQPIDHSE
jgi:hypothetical protein